MEKDVVLYDFCDTLVNFQTANAYVNYAIEKAGIRKSMVRYLRFILNRLRLMPVVNRFSKKISCNKALLLYELKGLPYDELDNIARKFYEELIRPNLIEPTICRLIQDVQNNKQVLIISGGYDIYLKYFVEEYQVRHLLCTELKFSNGTFSGYILGNDCMGKEKVSRLHEFLKKNKNENNKTSLTLYSDSDSDIPLFLECDKRIAILKDNTIPEWVSKIEADVIQFNCK